MRAKRWAVVVGIACTLAVVAAGSPAVNAQPPHTWVRPPNHPGAPSSYRGVFADPSVIRVGSEYFAYATNTGGSHLPVLRSSDLTTWRPLLSYNRTTAADRARDSANFVAGRPVHLANRPDNSFDPWINDGLLDHHDGVFRDITDHNHLRSSYWAPGVERIGNRYVAYSAVPQRNAEHRCIRISVSPRPEGPFRPINGTRWLQCDDKSSGVAFSPNGSIDPDPFVDTNGTPYLIWKSEGNPNPPFSPTVLWSRQLTADGSAFAPGSRKRELLRTNPGSWEGLIIENPSMAHIRGRYYLFYSGNDWEGNKYATGYAICEGPLGPCTRGSARPLMKSNDRFVSPGGADVFLALNGDPQIAFHHWVDGTLESRPATAYRALAVRRIVVRANGSLSVDGFGAPASSGSTPPLPDLPLPPPSFDPDERVAPVRRPPPPWAAFSPRP